MACKRFAGELKDVAAGGETAPGLVAHLEQCAACREALAAERRLVASIDADVMRAVGVELSAEFEARVRMHVASAPPTASWFGGWRLATALASFAAVAVVLTVVLVRWEGARAGRTPAVAGTPVAGGAERARVEPVVPPPAHGDVSIGERSDAIARDRVARARAHAAGHAKQTTPRAPEVLVAQDQQAVIARLVGMLSRGKLDAKALEQPSEAPPPPGPIVVGELTVAPIVVAPTGNEKQQ